MPLIKAKMDAGITSDEQWPVCGGEDDRIAFNISVKIQPAFYCHRK